MTREPGAPAAGGDRRTRVCVLATIRMVVALSSAGLAATLPPRWNQPRDRGHRMGTFSFRGSAATQKAIIILSAEEGGTGMRISLVEKEQASPVVQRIYHALELRSGAVAP